MADKRPLFFVKPFSESVQKLLEACQQNAGADNIEVMVVENANEFAQCIVQYGPSLSVFGHPKICAVCLQNNRKIISNLKCKVMLITPVNIPRKTLDKFMKLGLADYIMEPIAPKTLLYKVKLLIKALPSIQNEDDDIRKFSNSDDSNPENNQLKMKEKENSAAALSNSDNELSGNGAPADKLEDMKGKLSEAQQAIDTKYRGDVSKSEQEKDVPTLDEDEQDVTADIIEKYYKGQQSGSTNIINDDNLSGESKVDDVSDDEIDMLKQSVKLEVENDLGASVAKKQQAVPDQQEKNPKVKLDIEDETEFKDKTHDDSGPVISKKKKGASFSVEDEGTFKDKFHEESGPQIAKKKKGVSLDVDNETPNLSKNKADAIAPQIHKRKSNAKLAIEKDDDPLLDHAPMSAPEDEEDDALLLTVEDDGIGAQEDHGKVDDIDKYLRSKSAKKTELDIDDSSAPDSSVEDNGDESDLDVAGAGLKRSDKDDEDDSPAYDLKKEKLEEEDTPAFDLKKHKREQREKKEREMASLDIQQDRQLKNKKAAETPAPLSKKKTPGLKVEKDPLPPKTKDSDATTAAAMSKAKSRLDIEKEALASRALEEAAAAPKVDDDFGVSLQVDSDPQDDHGPKGKVDHIETYYGRKSKKPDGPQWQEKKQRQREVQVQAVTKVQLAKELIIEHDDLGTQTIDYKQLKEEFETLGSEWSGKSAPKYTITDENKTKDAAAPAYTADAKASSTPGLISMGSEGQAAPVLNFTAMEGPQASTTPGAAEIDNEANAPVFMPNSQGIEYALEILNIYVAHAKDHDIDKQIYDAIAKTCFKKFHAIASFLMMNWKKQELVTVHCAHQLFANQIVTTTWDALLMQEQARWSQCKLPTWSDPTFQAEKQEFLYPFYEGTSFLGVAVIHVESKVAEQTALKLEVLMESARACYLEQWRQAAAQDPAKTKDKGSNVEESATAGGLFKKLFGRKTA